MKSVKIRNKIVIIITFSLVYFSCNDTNKKTNTSVKHEERDNNHKALNFDINFETYGSKRLAYNKKTISIDSLIWKNRSINKDSIVYFNINLKNLKKEPFVIKTDLVATNIPFLIEYRKIKKESIFFDGTKLVHINLNIVQQFNTIYVDSLVFKIVPNSDFPYLEQAFNIGYQKIGSRSLCALHPIQYKDTIDLTNPKNEHICCIEVKK